MRIAVAMSGGVDSSLAALLLREEGHDIVGVSLRVIPSASAHEDAAMLCAAHGFPHHLLDVIDDFRTEIITPFCREYLQGRTPSPCVRCNPVIKFRRLSALAESLGCDALATGHYARVLVGPNGRHYIATGADRVKDQSYFLCMLSRDDLARVVFPLGPHLKEDIRRMARERGLHAADRPESQEICFVPDGDYGAVIRDTLGSEPRPGDIIDTGGHVIGRHRGIHRYTIGQRRGLGIAAPEPLYVLGIDPASNTITAGTRERLRARGLFAAGINYMKTERLSGSVLAKIRSTHTPARAHVEEGDGGVYARFSDGQPGVTPGQAVVFYDEEGGVLAGAWIERALQ